MDAGAAGLSQLNLSVPEQVLLLCAVALIVFVPGLVVVLASAWSGPSLAVNRPGSDRSVDEAGRGGGPPFSVVAMAAAPAVTFGGASLLTDLFADRGIRWNGTSFSWGFLGLAATSVLVCGLLWIVSAAVLSRFRERRSSAGPVNPNDDRPHGPEQQRTAPGYRRIRWWNLLVSSATVLLVGLIAVLSTWSMVRAVGGLDSTVPTFDALTHSTVMRWIAENGQACSTCLGDVNEPQNPDPYYPSAYHAVSAIGILLTGWQLPGAYVAMITLTAAVFVIGSVAMASEFGARNVALVVAAVVAVIIPFFPTALLTYGLLSPFAMGVAVLPGVVAAVAAALRRPSPGSVPVIALGILGVVALHPSVGLVAFSVAALQGLGAVIGRGVDVVRRRRGADVPREGSLLWVVVGAAVAAALSLGTVKTSAAGDLSGFRWPAVDTIGGSTDVVVFLTESPVPVRVLVLCLSAVGLIGVITGRAGFRRAVPTVVIGGAAMWLAVLARGSDEQWTVDLTYLWWNDWHRLAAISVIAWVAAAAVGAQALMRLASLGVSGESTVLRRLPAMLVALVLSVWSVAVAVVTEPSRSEIAAAGWVEDDRLVTDAELGAYAWLADHYEGGTVLNDPDDGSPWLYNLYGVPVVFNVPLGRTPEERYGEQRVLLNLFGHDAGVPGAVYQRDANHAIEDLDVRWVILGPTRVFGRQETAGGFLKLDESPAFDRVYENNGVVIYRVNRDLIASQI